MEIQTFQAIPVCTENRKPAGLEKEWWALSRYLCFVWGKFSVAPLFGLQLLATVLLNPLKTVIPPFLLYFNTFFLSVAAFFHNGECVDYGCSIVCFFPHCSKPCFAITQSPWLNWSLTNSDLLPENGNLFFLARTYFFSYLFQASPPLNPPSLTLF